MARPEVRCLHVLIAKELRSDPSGLDITGIIVSLEREKVPVRIPPLSVISFWRGPRGMKVSFTLRVRGEGDFVDESPAEGHIGPLGRGYFNVVLHDVTFEEYGVYRFEIVYEGEVHAWDDFAILPKV